MIEDARDILDKLLKQHDELQAELKSERERWAETIIRKEHLIKGLTEGKFEAIKEKDEIQKTLTIEHEEHNELKVIYSKLKYDYEQLKHQENNGPPVNPVEEVIRDLKIEMNMIYGYLKTKEKSSI